MSSNGYGGSYLASVGANPGGRSGCDGCSIPLGLPDTHFKNSTALTSLIINCVSLALVLLSIVGIRWYKQWADAASTSKHGIKTLVVAITSLVIMYSVDIANVSVRETQRRTTQAYFVLYVFMYAANLAGSGLLLVVLARFVRTQVAAGSPVTNNRASLLAVHAPLVSYSLLGLVGLLDIVAFIVYVVWLINEPRSLSTNNLIDYDDYVSHLYDIFNVIDIVYWALYMLVALWVLVTFARGFKAIRDVSRFIIPFTIFLLFSGAALLLACDAAFLYLENTSYYYGNESVYAGIYNLYTVGPQVQDILLAVSSVLIVVAALFAHRRMATVNGGQPVPETTSKAPVV